MKTRRGQWTAAGLLLGAALLGGSSARAQNFTTGSTSSTEGRSTVTLNNAPNFDPAAAAAAALVGNYRVPGARPVEPAGVYRVPVPDTSGGSAATTSTTTGATTSTTAPTGGTGAAPSAGGASP